MSKHTPGPWANTNDIAEEGFADIESVDGPLYIRASWGSMGRLAKGEKKRLLEEMEANSRLIAAVPDLMALLVESQENIGGDWRERRDALIAKLKGQP